MNNVLQNAAVYIANLFFLTADFHVQIVKDTELDQDMKGTVEGKLEFSLEKYSQL